MALVIRSGPDRWHNGRHRDIVTSIMISRSRSVERDLIRLPVGLPNPLYEWLREISFKEHRPMAEVIREALVDYRSKHSPQLDLPIEAKE